MNSQHLRSMNNIKCARFSPTGVVQSVVDVPAVDLVSPVFSPDGWVIGATTLLLRPELFLLKTP